MTAYPTVTCPICRRHVGSGLPGSWTPAHHAATLLVHQGACTVQDDPRWPEVAAAAREVVEASR